MRSRDIVRKAWQITQAHLKKLIWYSVVPSFFSVVVSSGYMAYQYNAFRTSPIFSDSSEHHDAIGAIKFLWDVIVSHPGISFSLLIFAAFFLLGYVVIPPIFHGALISAVMKIKNYEPIEGAMEVGIRHFFPMFEFGVLIGSFSITTLFTESSFILRWWGENMFFIALPVLLFVVLVGFIITFLFTYSEYYIIFENKQLLRSAMDSSVLVIANLRKTFLIFVLVLLISARIILNVILVLIIPMLVILMFSFFPSVLWHVFSFIVIGLVGLAILCASSYLLGLFHVFTTAVWVLTFSFIAHKDLPEFGDEDLGSDNFKKSAEAKLS
jgi:hypothetical protein